MKMFMVILILYKFMDFLKWNNNCQDKMMQKYRMYYITIIK